MPLFSSHSLVRSIEAPNQLAFAISSSSSSSRSAQDQAQNQAQSKIHTRRGSSDLIHGREAILAAHLASMRQTLKLKTEQNKTKQHKTKQRLLALSMILLFSTLFEKGKKTVNQKHLKPSGTATRFLQYRGFPKSPLRRPLK